MRTLRMTILLTCLLGGTSGYSQLITNDIDNFRVAFAKLKDCHTKDDSVRCIEKIMFENASDGFKALIRKFEFTPEDYYAVIKEYPKFFSSIRENILITKSINNEYLKLVEEMKNYYPDYTPLKVCFVISPLKCGGIQTDSSIIVGTEIIASTKKIDLSEFDRNLLGKVLAFDTNVRTRLIYVIAHETVHHLQRYAESDNYELLNKSLIEGAADFVAKLFTGVIANRELYDYGIIHEKELWLKFKEDLQAGANTDNWMYNYDRVENGIPADLGYFIGYRIVETYFNNVANKRQAVFDIIEMKDPKEFLEKSKYNGNQ